MFNILLRKFLKYSNVIIVVLLKVLLRHNIHIQEQQR